MVKLVASGYTEGSVLGSKGKMGGKGIYVFSLEPKTGALTLISTNEESENPSFLAAEKEGLLAACERIGTCFLDGYHWDERGRELKKVASVAVPGTAMCHVAVWPGKKFASVSNYMTGDFAVVALTERMRPLRLVKQERHFGVGFDRTFRQEGPHVHSTMVSPGGGWLLAADLGLDRVVVYHIDCETGEVELAADASQLYTPKGEGPRHMTFSPDGQFFYLLTEMGCHILTYAWDEANGGFTYLQTQALLPEGFTEANLSADLHISADGRFLYACNRGADDIVVFARQTYSGMLQKIGRHKLDGRGPRNFCLDSQGNFLAAACQSSGELLIYPIEKTGMPGNLLARAIIPQVSFCTVIE